MRLTKKAYAKINLFLDVLTKRDDGYHNIGTLFQRIGIHDLLHGELADDSIIELESTHAVTVNPQDNLIYKAACALKEYTGTNRGVRFLLEKKLPSGAGLGGGSADGAAALVLLNELWDLQLSLPELEKIAAPLGADIPFMIQGKSSFGEGIGDNLYPTHPPCDLSVLIITPDLFISTPDAYSALTPSGNQRYIDFKSQYLKYHGNILIDPTYLYNKFEETIIPKHPVIQELKETMREFGAVSSLLSGSGSSVFGLFEEKKSAERCLSMINTAKKYGAVTNFK
ncbi:MAG: 4-(cytidine 5'-diphospho)-2-C-methyl-D-erythritol kinase [Fibrobacterales bacterium]